MGWAAEVIMFWWEVAERVCCWWS